MNYYHRMFLAYAAIAALSSPPNSCHGYQYAPTVKPLFQSIPFIPLWNAPTELCAKRNVRINLKPFPIISSTLREHRGQNITLFYNDRFGFYPYIDENTERLYNGGLPQLANVTKHLNQAEKDLLYFLPFTENSGLAVIDWENWRPHWMRNWGTKQIYRALSIKIVQEKATHLSRNEVTNCAKQEFETAAKEFMKASLQLGKTVRPKQLWGYYLFPDCYNYDYKVDFIKYNGSCPSIEVQRNNEHMWLWNESTALFPSIYLESALASSVKGTLFARNRVYEAKRVAALPRQAYTTPVYVYVRLVFSDNTASFLSKDLVNTIGESAALGAAGIIVWEGTAITQTQASCHSLNSFVNNVLNPYIINVTTAAKICSSVLCQEKGRCIRKNWNSTTYLHLNPLYFNIESVAQRYRVHGTVTPMDHNLMAKWFTCQCYEGMNCLTNAMYPSDNITVTMYI
ncbi:hyaluronidase PH-20-like isoform X2 [Protopterus annectens]|uniref:hyaluronidase PH-20-like isoform X2 n=1 Tax=Protopterus annectens TaxID=7888 RepID=UPI001CF94517|nr:hyaluronidase PH-20-like isoform X2 [Protopterus annectens]